VWGIVLLLGLSMAADPVRIGIAVLLISRPRPMINLLAYWLGGMATGIGLGIGALILLRDFLPNLVHDVTASFTGGHAKIVVGVIALLIAAVNAVSLARQRAWVRTRSGDPSALAPQPSMPSAVSRLVARVRRVLEGGRPWVAFVAGLGQGPPPVEYLTALSVIVASGAAIGTQLCAAVAFTVAMFAIVEIPLVLYLVKPAQTETIMLSVNNWLRAHRRRILVVGAGVLGIVMVASGMSSI
jgi:hypothetical protein